MRSAELISPLTFRLTEMPIEDPGPGEVQCRVESVGVCGSDLHAYTEGQVGGMPNAYPMVLGHEPAGVIVKTGAGVTGLAAGDRGALEPALYCYHCEFCLSGHHNVCANIRFLSNPNHPGFFREFVNLPVSNFAPIPATLSFDAATLAEPLAIALHSVHLASIAAGETVAVIGAGPIGLLTIAALRAANAGRIWAIEPLAHRRELARAMGADAVLEPEEAVAEILRATGQRGVDCAISGGFGTVCPRPGTWRSLVAHRLWVPGVAGSNPAVPMALAAACPPGEDLRYRQQVGRRRGMATGHSQRGNHRNAGVRGVTSAARGGVRA